MFKQDIPFIVFIVLWCAVLVYGSYRNLQPPMYNPDEQDCLAQQGQYVQLKPKDICIVQDKIVKFYDKGENDAN